MRKRVNRVLSVLIGVLVLFSAAWLPASASQETSWNFENGSLDVWQVYPYCTVSFPLTVGTAETNALKISYAWQASSNYDWSVAPQICTAENFMTMGDYKYVQFDFYLEAGKSTKGKIEVFPILNSPQYSYWFAMNNLSLTISSMTPAGSGLLKYSACIPLTNTSGQSIKSTDSLGRLTFVVVGGATDYDGGLFFDNIRFTEQEETDPGVLNIKSITSGALAPRTPFSLTPTVTGAVGSVSYQWIVMRGQNLCYLGQFSTSPALTYAPYRLGTYQVILNCKDTGGQTAQFTKTITIRDPSIPPDKYIALTFDDGPCPTSSAFADMLKEKDAHATFFYVGQMVQQYPSMAQQVASKGGFDFGNHTWTHTALTSLSDEQILQEIDSTSNAIFSATGMTPKYIRPPYIAFNYHILSITNLPFVNVSVDSMDWSGITTEQIVSNVVTWAKSGDIVLLHEPLATTRAAVPQIIDQLRDKGFAFVTVEELFAIRGGTLEPGFAYSSAY